MQSLGLEAEHRADTAAKPALQEKEGLHSERQSPAPSQPAAEAAETSPAQYEELRSKVERGQSATDAVGVEESAVKSSEAPLLSDSREGSTVPGAEDAQNDDEGEQAPAEGEAKTAETQREHEIPTPAAQLSPELQEKLRAQWQGLKAKAESLRLVNRFTVISIAYRR